MNIRHVLFAFAVSCTSLFARAENSPIPILGYGLQGDGIARHRVGTTTGRDSVSAVEVLADGRLLLGGESMLGFDSDAYPRRHSFMRLLPDGRLDTTFGEGGRGSFVLDSPAIHETVGMFSDPQGQIVYAGYTTQLTAVVGKVTASGVPVSGFGQGGRRFIGPGLFSDTAIAFIPRRMVKLQSGGVLVVGVAGVNATYCAALARLTPQGNFDTAFGGNGAACIAPPRNGPPAAGANDVVELPDGRLLVVGQALRAGGVGQDMFVARLSADGELDTAFGTNGSGFAFMAFDAGGELNDVPNAVAIDARGRIVIAGQVSVDLPGRFNDMALARFTSDGRVDVAFGSEGRVQISDVLPSSDAESAQGIQVLADGRMLVNGFSTHFSSIITIVMIKENGTVDSNFGVNGEFVQAAPDSGNLSIIFMTRRSAHLAGDHLHLFGEIAVDTSSPSSQAFATAKYLMPLLRDGFDG